MAQRSYKIKNLIYFLLWRGGTLSIIVHQIKLSQEDQTLTLFGGFIFALFKIKSLCKS